MIIHVSLTICFLQCCGHFISTSKNIPTTWYFLDCLPFAWVSLLEWHVQTLMVCVQFLKLEFFKAWLLTVEYAIHAGKIVLQALVLTAAVVCSLTGYTFWAAKKGKDFSFLGPVLFASLIGLIFTGLLQVMSCSHCILQTIVFPFSFILF